MMRLKSLLMTIPFLLAAAGAFLLAGMLTTRIEPPRLPFAYVLHSYAPEGHDMYDLRVMDVLSREILFEVNSPLYDCPLPISPDGRWLLYGQSDNEIRNQEYSLVDLSTEEESAFPYHMEVVDIHWNGDSFHYLNRTDNFSREEGYSLYQYNLTSHQRLSFMTLTFSSYPYPIWVQAVGDELFYILQADDQRELTVYRNEEIVISPPLLEGQIYSARLSADARYLSYVEETSNNEFNAQVVNIQTGERTVFQITSKPDFMLWKPDTSSLIYFARNRDLVSYDADTQEVTTYTIPQDIYREDVVRVDEGSGGWSLDGRYLAYKIYNPGGTDNENYSMYVLDTVTGDSIEIGWHVSTWAANMDWLNATQLVYTYADTDAHYFDEQDRNHHPNADLWMYDITTGEATQLTDTPDIDERFQCGFG